MSYCYGVFVDLDRQITLEKGKIKGVSDGRTLQSVRNDVQEKDELVSNLSRKIDQKRDKFMEHQKTLSSMEREVNDINSELVNVSLLFIFIEQHLKTCEKHMKV